LNEHIIEEYDAIKNYFANVLKTKKIEVVATIKTTDSVITSLHARSAEIEKIDKTLIEEVKFDLVRIARGKEINEDKQLFTMEEYVETFVGEDVNAQALFKNENDFFEYLLERSETKHYKQLRFLSSKHRADLQKLRFVHNPFSFVFLVSGKDKFHIVWETLDTQEATYIWTFDNNINKLTQPISHTEKTINQIIIGGKNEYISQNEKNFKRVFHDYTDLQNGFKNWKREIEKIIL
jgi:hypothetical protein